MENINLLAPTLHVDVALHPAAVDGSQDTSQIRHQVEDWIRRRYVSVRVGQEDMAKEFEDDLYCKSFVDAIELVDYTGPKSSAVWHAVENLDMDVQVYTLHDKVLNGERRNIPQPQDESQHDQPRVLALPNVVLSKEWNSLIFEDELPARLLRYLIRMICIMKQPNLNLSAFNWNRLVLLHGPAGSGKSTLCRALAQKLSIRLASMFPNFKLVEINAVGLLSKFFGESSKLIHDTFRHVEALAGDSQAFVCVIMDEIESIASSREKVFQSNECSDGMRATNQLLTALDGLRRLSNIIILCTSNLISAIDPALLDRIDVKQLVPGPTPATIYNIFRSSLNELVQGKVVGEAVLQLCIDPSPIKLSGLLAPCTIPQWWKKGSTAPYSPPLSDWAMIDNSSNDTPTSQNSVRASEAEQTYSTPRTISSDPWVVTPVRDIPSLAETRLRLNSMPKSLGSRVFSLAQKCEGLSGRTLRRLPVVGLAMYTWGGSCTLNDAVAALEAAVEQELKGGGGGGGGGGGQMHCTE